MTRVAISDFGIIQKNLANAVVTFYQTDANGANTGVLAPLYQAATGAPTQSNPQTLDANGMLAQACYIDAEIMATITGIGALTERGIKKVRDNPLSFSLPVTSANWSRQAGQDLYTNLAAVQQAVDDAQDVLEDSNFIAVAGDLLGANHIGTVSGIATAVANVAAALSALNALNSDLTALNNIASDLTALNAVAASLTALNALNTNLTALLADNTNITALLAINTNMTALLAINSNLTTITNAANNIPKANLVGTVAPVVGNDNTQGYAAGSMWVDTVGGKVYFAQSVATGAASWVQAIASTGSVNYVAKTSTYAILTTDVIVEATSGTFTATLPTAVGCAGKPYILKNSGVGVLTIATTSAQTIDGAAPGTLAQYQALSISSNGANWITTA